MHSFLSHSVIVCVKWLPKEQTFHVELLHLPCCQVSVTCLIEAYLALKAVNIGSKKVYGISISNPAQHSLFSPGPVSKLRACSLPHPLSSASLLPACPSGRGEAATDQGRPAGATEWGHALSCGWKQHWAMGIWVLRAKGWPSVRTGWSLYYAGEKLFPSHWCKWCRSLGFGLILGHIYLIVSHTSSTAEALAIKQLPLYS